jgi:hypothetical protein
VRHMAGTFVLGVAAIAASVFAVAVSWPWPWWAWAAVAAPAVTGGVLMIWRDRHPAALAGNESPEGGGAASSSPPMVTDDVTNTVSGGTFSGPVIQGRDVTGLTFGTSGAAQPAHPPEPEPGS